MWPDGDLLAGRHKKMVVTAPPGIAVNSRVLTTTNSVLAVAVSVAPLLGVDLSKPACDWLKRFVPLLGHLLAALLRRISAACEALRLRRERLFVLIHGATTYAIGDVSLKCSEMPRPDTQASSNSD